MPRPTRLNFSRDPGLSRNSFSFTTAPPPGSGERPCGSCHAPRAYPRACSPCGSCSARGRSACRSAPAYGRARSAICTTRTCFLRGCFLRHQAATSVVSGSGPSRLPKMSLTFLPRRAATERGLAQALQPGERRLDHVVRVAAAERLGDHVANAQRLEHRAHRAAGDDARAGLGRSATPRDRRHTRPARRGAECALPSSARGSWCAWPARSPCGSPPAPRAPCRRRSRRGPSGRPRPPGRRKANRRPPFTTLATRLMVTSLSIRSSPPSRSRSRPPRPPPSRSLVPCPIPSERQPAFAGGFGQRFDAAVIQIRCRGRTPRRSHPPPTPARRPACRPPPQRPCRRRCAGLSFSEASRLQAAATVRPTESSMTWA